MQKSSFACSWIGSVPLIANVFLSVIYAHNAHANRITATLSKFRNLVSQIADYSVDLFDHSLSEDLHFDANFDGCHKSPSNSKALVDNRRLTWNDFSKGAVSPPCRDTMPSIVNIQHPSSVLDFSYQFR